jgi:hypothetical protein
MVVDEDPQRVRIVQGAAVLPVEVDAHLDLVDGGVGCRRQDETQAVGVAFAGRVDGGLQPDKGGGAVVGLEEPGVLVQVGEVAGLGRSGSV